MLGVDRGTAAGRDVEDRGTAAGRDVDISRADHRTGDRNGAVRDIATRRTFSYAETATRAARIGAWLRSSNGGGLALGARVGLLAPNGAAVLEAHFACAWAGLVVLNCSRRRETQARGVAHPQTGRGAAAAAT